MKRPPARLCLWLCVLSLGLAPRAFAQTSALAWLNAVRHAAGAPPVMEDDLLSRTALDWARTLAQAGVISHRGTDGSTGLDRYRSHGGTDARVGEIIGAGPRLASIERGWEGSPSHRTVTLGPSWTHAGVGEWPTPGGEVCVLMLCVRLVEDLRVIQEGAQLLVSGRFTTRAATGALLAAGMDAVKPESWDPASRTFSFRLASGGLASYIRLGFVTSDGDFSLTNAFTLSLPPTSRRETVSPGERGRFEGPGAPR